MKGGGEGRRGGRGSAVNCEVFSAVAACAHSGGGAVGIYGWRRCQGAWCSRVRLGLHPVPVVQPVDHNEEEGVGTECIWSEKRCTNTGQ